MTKAQWASVGAALILLLVVYLGCETKPRNLGQLAKARAMVATATSIEVLIREAKDSLAPADLALVEAMERDVQQQQATDDKVSSLQRLSGQWFKLGRPVVAGHYAEEIAQLQPTEETWAIAGTTYAIAARRSPDQRIRRFAAAEAAQAFEKAQAINPQELDHQINLALVYTDNPPPDNAMKGILLLRELNEKYPNQPSILLNLGRLAVTTGQWARAIERLEQAVKIDPNLTPAFCLLSEAYAGLGNQAKAESFGQRCAQGQASGAEN